MRKKPACFGMFLVLLHFMLVTFAHGEASMDSLQRLVLGSNVTNVELEGVVFCSSVKERTEPIGRRLQEMADQTFSLEQWSNAVSSLVKEVIQTNSAAERQLWHLHFQQSGDNMRYDTLENFFGKYISNATYLKPSVTRVAVGNPVSTEYTNFVVTSDNNTVRISGQPNTFFNVVPRQYLMEISPSIVALVSLIQKEPSVFVYQDRPFGGDLTAFEISIKGGGNKSVLAIRALYSPATSNWIGIFILNPKGGVTSASLSSRALGLPLSSPAIYWDQIQTKDGARPVATLVDPVRSSIGTVTTKAFDVAVPVAWTVIDERAKKVTKDGKSIGEVKIISPNGSTQHGLFSKNYKSVLIRLFIAIFILGPLVAVVRHVTRKKTIVKQTK